MKINIAIDGPSAAGKSTVAKKIASKLNYIHLDTGAMYRCVAYKAQQMNIDLMDIDRIMKMIETTVIRLDAQGRVFLDEQDVTSKIRTNELSLAASNVSANARVREELVKRQQEMSKEKGFILDGRDIGTVVLTDAELKIYQTASSDSRAKRRYDENKSKNIDSDYQKLKEEIEKRDYQDMNRECSPLKQADDAVLIDTSDMNIDQVVDKILELASLKINKEV